ncbi:amino acid ABC transporter substrate-binding protein, PAAT family [Pseudonocardia thermophila]|uniref:Amino acid ABC transporter substrate-binding protein, PAAT family n=1 Tax=Pseudonocardia thermophila TaxID=1848 RepID=A0A1M6SHU7_PSETH|nr:ABC transporter substrate-binding protein [Pseudonocardia thermophila]SHK44332.1 amino acid ABC transporter substrate-binding protein, PAAT family [Pseudonocardia thermophila]
MNRRARLVVALLAAVLGTALAACAPVPEPEPADSAAGCPKGDLPTLTPGVLTIATDQPAYEPWFTDDDPTTGKGFESALAYAIANELGYGKDRVSWVRVPFNAAIQPGPKSFDFNLNQFSISEERRAAVDFSSPYYDVKQTVITIAGSPVADATTIAELKRARLGAQVGTTSLDALNEQIAPTTKPAVYSTNDDAKLALQNGQIDGIVVDLPTAFYITSAELENGKIVGQLPASPGTPEQFGAVLHKGSPLTGCVSAAVDRLRTSGALAALEKQWLASAGTAPELR